MKKLTIKADPDNLDELLNYVEAELNQHGFPSGLQSEIIFAVEELFLNIAHYAYGPAGGDVDVFVSVNEKACLRFEDTGKPFNPLEQAAPNLDIPVMERKIGGLGIFLVKQLMDEITYSYKDNKNILTIKK